MLIVANNSYLSVVQDQYDNTRFVVRARIKGDLENFFKDSKIDVIETENSDYRFRVFVDKDFFTSHVVKNINNIDYNNFKDSVEDPKRKSWYTQIWYTMYKAQEEEYEI